MQVVGFEPTPPKRPVPETSALDHSATLAWYILSFFVILLNWIPTQKDTQIDRYSERYSERYSNWLTYRLTDSQKGTLTDWQIESYSDTHSITLTVSLWECLWLCMWLILTVRDREIVWLILTESVWERVPDCDCVCACDFDLTWLVDDSVLSVS